MKLMTSDEVIYGYLCPGYGRDQSFINDVINHLCHLKLAFVKVMLSWLCNLIPWRYNREGDTSLF